VVSSSEVDLSVVGMDISTLKLRTLGCLESWEVIIGWRGFIPWRKGYFSYVAAKV
jgi:hypothetical protein